MDDTTKTYLLTYSYVPDMAERRQPHRADHLAHLRRAQDEGRLLVAAATVDPVDAAVLLVNARSPGDVLAWVADDPYTRAGLIRGVVVRELAVAVAPWQM